MSAQYIEPLKLIASFLTPIIILIFGISINKKLEKTRAALLKEKDWQNWWASKLLNVAHEYNSMVSEFVISLSQAVQINEGKFPGGEAASKEKQNCAIKCIFRLQYLVWDINNYLQFAHKEGRNLLDKGEKLNTLLETLLKERHGGLDAIRKAQCNFNDAVRLVHAEILGISPGKAFQPRQDQIPLDPPCIMGGMY
ncbi:hypothetical protein LLH00_00060 [bacterium]|nr:hypothetical protein [bacterium]